MKKSLLSSILAFSMIMTSVWTVSVHADVTEDSGALTVSAQAEPEATSTPKRYIMPIEFSDAAKIIDVDGWKIRYMIDDGEATVYTLSGESTNTSNILEIPEYIDGYPVTVIGGFILNEVSWVEEVVLPDTVYKINEAAFEGGKIRNEVDGEWHGLGIKKIRLSKNLREIGNNAFKNTRLEEITLPDTLEKIGSGAFENSLLKEIEFPASLRKIGDFAFVNTKLKEVYIPENLEELGRRAFQACQELVKVNLPSKFKDKVEKPFSNCPNIEEVDFEGELTANMILTFEGSKFLNNHAKTCENQMLIRDGVLLVYAGEDKNVVIPEGVTEIQKACFKDMDIESVTFPSTLRYINEQAFYRTSLKELYIPANVKSIGQFAFFDIETLTKLTIEDKQQYPQIGLGAFENCSNLKSVTLPKRLAIAAQAFDGTPYEGKFKVGQNDTTGLQATIEAKETEKPELTEMPEGTPTPNTDSVPVLEVTNQNGEVEVSVENEEVVFFDAKPFIDENDRTQLPIRAVAESIGCEVGYDEETQTVTINSEDIDITLKIGEQAMLCNGETIIMDTAARIVDDRTYVPVRYIAESMGYEVVWR